MFSRIRKLFSVPDSPNVPWLSEPLSFADSPVQSRLGWSGRAWRVTERLQARRRRRACRLCARRRRIIRLAGGARHHAYHPGRERACCRLYRAVAEGVTGADGEAALGRAQAMATRLSAEMQVEAERQSCDQELETVAMPPLRGRLLRRRVHISRATY
jgi:hypothetical protein